MKTNLRFVVVLALFFLQVRLLAWQPTDNNDLLAWYKADAGVITDGNGNVTSWQDQSGNGHDISPISGYAPFKTTADFVAGNLTVLDFNNAILQMDAPAALKSSSVSVYIVAKTHDPNQGKQFAVVCGDYPWAINGGWRLAQGDQANGSMVQWEMKVQTPESKSTWPYANDDQWHIVTGRYDENGGEDSEVELFVDNVKSSWPEFPDVNTILSYPAGSKFSIGGAGVWSSTVQGNFNGYIAEVLIFKTVDNLQMARVRTYLENKYFNNQFPAGDPNLLAWYEADAGVITDGNGNVTSWQDQSGNGHDISPISGYAPFKTTADFVAGNLTVLDFNNAILQMDAPAALKSSSVSVYIVAKTHDPNQGKQFAVVCGDYPWAINGGWRLAQGDQANGSMVQWEMKVQTPESKSTWPYANDDQWHIVTGRYDENGGEDSEVELFVDNVKSSWPEFPDVNTILSYPAGSKFSIGGAGVWYGAVQGNFNGYIAEILIFDSIDDVQKHWVKTYLNGKYFYSQFPRTEQNLKAWFKADKGVIVDDFDSVTCWKDQSGNAYDVVPTISGSAVAPVLGEGTFVRGELPAVVFDNHNHLSKALAADDPLKSDSVSVYAVAKCSENEVSDNKSRIVMVEKPGNNPGWILQGGNDRNSKKFNFQVRASSDSEDYMNASNHFDKDSYWHMLTGRYDPLGDYIDMYQDSVGALQNQIGTNWNPPLVYNTTGVNLSIGASGVWSSDAQYAFDGKISEILIYDSVDEMQLENVESYLRTKYFKAPFRVLFQNDNGYFMDCNSPYRSLGQYTEKLKASIDELAGTGVDAHFFRLMTCQIPNYQSNHYPQSDHWAWLKNTYGQNPDNIIGKYLAQGDDMVEVFVNQCRLNGQAPFISFWMNQGAAVLSDPNSYKGWTSKFYVDNPNYRLGIPIDIRGEILLDWAESAVRDWQFAFLDEVAHNYDIDGIELDFQRYCYLFDPNTTTSIQRKSIITGFVSDVRQLLDDTTPTGKHRWLSVRVPHLIVAHDGLGIDIEEMVNAGVEMIIVSSWYYLNQQTDLEDIIQMVPNASIYLESTYCTYAYQHGYNNYRRLTNDHQLYTASHLAQKRGAAGISLFNFPYYRNYDYEPPFASIQHIEDLQWLGQQPQWYFMDDMENNYIHYAPTLTFPLPKMLNNGQTATFVLDMAPVETLQSGIFRLMTKSPCTSCNWTVKVNGITLTGTSYVKKPLPHPYEEGLEDSSYYACFECPVDLITDGNNSIEIKLNSGGPTTLRYFDIVLW